jgi:hypothetical protein
LLGLGRFFSFLILYTVSRTPWKEDQPVARSLPVDRKTHTQNKRTQTSMPRVGFEPTIPVLKRRPMWSAFRVNIDDKCNVARGQDNLTKVPKPEPWKLWRRYNTWRPSNGRVLQVKALCPAHKSDSPEKRAQNLTHVRYILITADALVTTLITGHSDLPSANKVDELMRFTCACNMSHWNIYATRTTAENLQHCFETSLPSKP